MGLRDAHYGMDGGGCIPSCFSTTSYSSTSRMWLQIVMLRPVMRLMNTQQTTVIRRSRERTPATSLYRIYIYKSLQVEVRGHGAEIMEHGLHGEDFWILS